MPKKTVSVDELLESAAATYRERNEIYGDNYKVMHGKLMDAFFPDGLELVGKDDFNRFAAFNAIVAKLTRYVNMWDEGGHVDSIHDAINFCAMLQEIDSEIS